MGICVTTHCQSVDQFVSTFQRYCEDAAIFIPNGRREVGTTLPFSFELANEESVLVGIGLVVEAYATVNNRFGREGIVIDVKKLKRESVPIFERMLAARKQARAERTAPPLTFPRPVTISLEELRRARRRTTGELEVPILKPLELVGGRRRGNTGVLPVIAKAPALQPVVQIPPMPPHLVARRDAETKRRPPFEVPTIDIDAIPALIDDADTARDELPFALRHELRLLEARAPVVPLADVDAGWDIEEAPSPSPAPSACETLIDEETVRTIVPNVASVGAWKRSAWSLTIAAAVLVAIAAVVASRGSTEDPPRKQPQPRSQSRSAPIAVAARCPDVFDSPTFAPSSRATTPPSTPSRKVPVRPTKRKPPVSSVKTQAARRAR